MYQLVPKYYFLTKGLGMHRDKLASFEAALRDARIAPYNIIRVSSIFAPEAKIISRKIGLEKLTRGQILPCVLSENATNEPHRLIAASIGVAIPKDRKNYGYLSEYHAFGQTESFAGDYAEDLAAQMLASTLGVEFDPDTSYDKIVRTQNITQSAIGDKNGLWTTVLAAAVLIT